MEGRDLLFKLYKNHRISETEVVARLPGNISHPSEVLLRPALLFMRSVSPVERADTQVVTQSASVVTGFSLHWGLVRFLHLRVESVVADTCTRSLVARAPNR